LTITVQGKSAKRIAIVWLINALIAFVKIIHHLLGGLTY
jgi:hypothetical protein